VFVFLEGGYSLTNRITARGRELLDILDIPAGLLENFQVVHHCVHKSPPPVRVHPISLSVMPELIIVVPVVGYHGDRVSAVNGSHQSRDLATKKLQRRVRIAAVTLCKPSYGAVYLVTYPHYCRPLDSALTIDGASLRRWQAFEQHGPPRRRSQVSSLGLMCTVALWRAGRYVQSSGK
jgi:hypothetical protein